MTTTPKIAAARALRNAASPPERRLWGFLRILRSDGYHFRRQVPFRGYVLDFACYRQRLVIEIDGAHHGAEPQRTHDALRDAVLSRAGFLTLRFSARDVLQNLEGVSIAIRNHLAMPHPNAPSLPPPPRGEGRGGGAGD